MSGSPEKFFQSQEKKRDLDDFAEFFDGPLSEEEQALILQLKQREQEIDQRLKQDD